MKKLNGEIKYEDVPKNVVSRHDKEKIPERGIFVNFLFLNFI